MHRVAAVLLGAFVALAGCSPTAAFAPGCGESVSTPIADPPPGAPVPPILPSVRRRVRVPGP